MAKKLTRRKMENLPRESIHKARNWSKADVSVAEWPPNSGQRVVIKELRGRPLWYRVLAGRYFLRREWKALCALADVNGVPNPVARPDSDTIVMEFREGRPIEKLGQWDVPDSAVENIEKLVEAMHAKGITHGDLHGYNILVDKNGAVALIDWATASTFSSQRRGLKSFTFNEWQALDDRALAKVKIVSAPLSITPRQHDLLLNGGSQIYRFVKQFKSLGERVRGVDEEKLSARERKQQAYQKRLEKYDPAQSQEDIQKLQQKLQHRKQLRRDLAKKARAESSAED